MTIIAACVDHDGNVWMGADSICGDDRGACRVSATSKVFRLGEMLIGSTGTRRAHQIIELLVDVPVLPPDTNLIEWLVRDFSVAARSAMKAHGGECKNRNGEDEMDGRILIGLRGNLFIMDCGYGVFAPTLTLEAVGCADQEARAAMLTALKLRPDMHARAVVQYGLEAAAELDINIRPPFEIICSSQESVAGIHAVA